MYVYKDLIVPATATAADADAMNVALGLARAFGARLTALQIVRLPVLVGDPWGLTPDLAAAEIFAKLRAQGAADAARLQSRLEREDVASEVRTVETMAVDPARVAARHAHQADLAIVAGGVGDTAEAAVNHAYFGALLLESGRPVLSVPPGYGGTMPPKRVVIAWKPAREAARAVHEALPLLVRAEAVEVLAIDPAGGEPGPGAELAAHLARHGVRANARVREGRSREVGAAILEHARATDAQMIVAGGYGHSRLREWALGGATRELLLGASVPVFYSH